MKRLSLGISLFLVVGAAGCPDETTGEQTCPGGAAACTVPWDCDPGFTCKEGCCEEFGCTPDSCSAGEFCDIDFACKTVEQKCADPFSAPNGCECHILNAAGELEATETPTITMAPGGQVTLQAVLAAVGGSPLPGANFTWSIDEGSDDNQFTLTGDSLTTLDVAAGTATLQASAGSIASCTATIKNIGTAPTGDQVRFLVFDDRTGKPIEGAEIVVDIDKDGDDDGWTPPDGSTGADGIAETTELGAAATYDVTVFAEDYNYLSVVGLSVTNAGNDVALPLSARPAERMTGGFTGKINWDPYEQIVLGGTQKTIKFGMVSGSFPLKALLNFDLDLLIGEMADSATCENNSSAPGCYPIKIPGLIDEVAPLPGGVVLSLAASPIKSHFDVMATPGRRYAWALGGEVEAADLAGLIGIIMPLIGDCTCDNTPDACETTCDCDPDCGIDFGGLFDNLVPLFSAFASAVEGNLALPAVTVSTWNDYIDDEYGVDRVDAAGKFPKLDSDGRGKLPLREPLHTFTDFTVPGLPEDPASTDPDVKMEGMIVLTGVNTIGQGFVPLGLGVGLDCTEGNCLDREGTSSDPGVFDGEVNGGLMCVYDPDLNRCPPGVPTTPLPDGHLGMFHAKAHGGLEGQEHLTIAVALPISSLAADSQQIRAAAVVVREKPTQGASSQLSVTYPEFPTREPTQQERHFVLNDTPDTDVHWVTIATDEQGGQSTRWNIYFPDNGGDFAAPVPPVAGRDPFDPETNGIGRAVTNVCGEGAICTPLTTCPAETCGEIPDGCGSTVKCSHTCTVGTCGGGGTPNVCGEGTLCTPATTCPASAECGHISDGCNDTVDCGGCTSGVCGAIEHLLINATHIGFEASATLGDLVSNNGTTLSDLVDEVNGFTVTSGDVPVQ